MAENLPGGTELGVVGAEDADSGANGAVRYRLRDGGASSHLFHVDAASGTLSTRQRLDREAAGAHLLSVVAYDGGVPSKSSSVVVRVGVRDVNDSPPRFRFPSPPSANRSAVLIQLSPDTPLGFVVAHLDAVDPDLGNNAHVTYSATVDSAAPAAAASPLAVEPQSGAVVVVESLAQRDGELLEVGVMATDDGGLAATSVLRLVVNSSSTFGLVGSAGAEASPTDRGRTGGGFAPSVRLMVVVGVVVGCSLLAVVLVVAIAVVRTQRSSKRSRHHYNCRTAACVRLQQTTSPAWTPGHPAGAPPLSVEVYTPAKSSHPGSPLGAKPSADATCSGDVEQAVSGGGSLRSSIYNGTWSSGSRQLYQPSPCARSPSLDCASLTCLRYHHAQVGQQ